MIILCIGCGCSDNYACVDTARQRPCHWSRLDAAGLVGLCSACEPTHAPTWDLAAVEAAKLEVLFTREEAWQWLRTPQRLLANQVPLNLIYRGVGDWVQRVIQQIREGVFL